MILTHREYMAYLHPSRLTSTVTIVRGTNHRFYSLLVCRILPDHTQPFEGNLLTMTHCNDTTVPIPFDPFHQNLSHPTLIWRSISPTYHCLPYEPPFLTWRTIFSHLTPYYLYTERLGEDGYNDV